MSTLVSMNSPKEDDLEKVVLPEIELIGLSLRGKTTNENQQSSIDCGKLWTRFEKEQVAEKIEGKLNNRIFAVYHDFDSDHHGHFSYFIGCEVALGAEIREHMERLIIPAGTFIKKTATGKIPDCIADAWKEIWDSHLQRTYRYDFEVYDERSRDWYSGEVDILVSI